MTPLGKLADEDVGRHSKRDPATQNRRDSSQAATHIIRSMAEWLNEAKAIDTAVYEAIAAGRTPALDIAMRRLSRAADHSVLWLGTAGVLALFGGPGGRHAARRGLASLGLASAFANLVAKPLTTRRRPTRRETDELARRHVPMPSTTSFPSGHTASAFAFATGAAAAQPALSAPLRALATLVGYSRVHTGVHYPADVLVGAFIGVSAAEVAGRMHDG
jgi:undecaprenyl-diphosphatase